MSMCFLIRTEYYLRLKLTALEVSKSLIKASIPVFYFKIGFTNFNNNLPFSFNHVKYIFYKLLLVINDLIEQFDPKIFSHCKASLSKRMNTFSFVSYSTFVAHCAHTALRPMQENTATKWRPNKPERKAKRCEFKSAAKQEN